MREILVVLLNSTVRRPALQLAVLRDSQLLYGALLAIDYGKVGFDGETQSMCLG